MRGQWCVADDADWIAAPQRRVLIPFTGLLPCLSHCEIFARLRSNNLSMLAMPLVLIPPLSWYPWQCSLISVLALQDH
ncbi:hypothetical protein Pelo_18884 [Pelomyxa schiedti]|nr:hypothetical protein Pelo_18884 [Pelomyxa schiedti]